MQQIDSYKLYRCRIEGKYKGIFFTYEDSIAEKSGIYYENGHTHFYYWEDGNYSCDCNRVQFLPQELITKFNIDLENPKCGEEILLYRIIPIDDITIPEIPLCEIAESRKPKPVIYDTTQITSKENGSNPQPGDPSHPLTKGGHVPLLVEKVFTDNQNRGFRTRDGITPPLLRNMGTGGGNVPFIKQDVAIPINTMTCQGRPSDNGRMGLGVGENGDPQNTLSKAHQHAVCHTVDNPIAFGWQNSENQGDSAGNISPTLDKSKTPAILQQAEQPIILDHQGGSVMNVSQNGKVGTLRAQTHAHEPIVKDKTLIRRLTPLECERLQGFPDNFTLIPGASDSKRYAALGNSMTVQVMAWLGKRIQLVDDAMREINQGTEPLNVRRNGV